VTKAKTPDEALEALGEYFYDQLMDRVFFVVDTEYTAGPTTDPAPANGEPDLMAGNHVISLAIVPVFQGVPQHDEAFYCVMKPAVPITASSTKVHGFDDENVADEPPFAHWVDQILSRLQFGPTLAGGRRAQDRTAVWVSHSTVDVHALRAELARYDASHADRAGSALAQLPDFPILDTVTLGRDLGVMPAGREGLIKLRDLAALANVPFEETHNALRDATATADCLLWLMRQAANTGRFDDLDSVLARHQRGTTRAPLGPANVERRSHIHPKLDVAHRELHAEPLEHTADAEDLEAFVTMARDCVTLRCELLRPSVAATAPYNGPALLEPLAALLADATEPGQAGSAAGALAELIAGAADQPQPALTARRALNWWTVQRPRLAEAPECGTEPTECCPDCRAGQSCPQATLYQVVADVAVYGEKRALDYKRIKNVLVGTRATPSAPSRFARWQRNHPLEAAWLLYRVIAWEQERGLSVAGLHLNTAVESGSDLLEPRLGLLVAQARVESGQIDEATALVTELLDRRRRDSAYADLDAWLTWSRVGLAPRDRSRRRGPLVRPNAARPDHRQNHNPYSLAERAGIQDGAELLPANDDASAPLSRA
jgi:DNA polymerase III epsilon subunit-like protein